MLRLYDNNTVMNHTNREAFLDILKVYYERTLSNIQLDQYESFYNRKISIVKATIEQFHKNQKTGRDGYRQLPKPYELQRLYNSKFEQREYEELGVEICPKCDNTGQIFLFSCGDSVGTQIYQKEPYRSNYISEAVGFCACVNGRKLHMKKKASVSWELVKNLCQNGYAFSRSESIEFRNKRRESKTPL